MLQAHDKAIDVGTVDEIREAAATFWRAGVEPPDQGPAQLCRPAGHHNCASLPGDR